MDLNAVGINYTIFEHQTSFERATKVKKTAEEKRKDQERPIDKKTSVANLDKGRVVDVSF